MSVINHNVILSSKEIKEICLSLAQTYNQLDKAKQGFSPVDVIYEQELKEILDIILKLKPLAVGAHNEQT